MPNESPGPPLRETVVPFQAGALFCRRMKRSTFRSATAAMVEDGFTPVEAGRMAPSSTNRPG